MVERNLSLGGSRAIWPEALLSSAGLAAATILVTEATAGSAVLIAVSTILIVQNWRLRQAARKADGSHVETRRTRVGTTRAPSGEGRELADRLARIGHRLDPFHPVSGMAVREALLAQIEADGRGVLGVIAFVDFDRLTAFDPAMGERVFRVLAGRLRRMVPTTRFMAQIDRAHIAIWFGDHLAASDARAELEAISYALSDTLIDDCREIEPQVEVRLATFDPQAQMAVPAFLARTLASFALAQGATIADRPLLDPAELARERYDFEQDVRQALPRRELALEFQPLIDAAAGRVCGAEALLRWHHPERGAVSPARFVPVIEAMGIAGEIGAWVLNSAVREAGVWQLKGFSDLRMAVNVSGLQLEGDQLPTLVERTLQRHELGPDCLEIELTESIATSNADHCRRIFERLRDMGVKLAVDDFGTGYSGFSSLRMLRFDKIKIDREFVTDVDTRRDSQAICQSIIALARGLGIRVLAEGVERHDEYAWLRRHGCMYFQGYYFSRPLDADRFAAFVGDTRGLDKLLSLGGERQNIINRLRA